MAEFQSDAGPRASLAPQRGSARRWGRVAAALFFAALLFVSSPTPALPSNPADSSPRQVIWILLDAARADRFSSYGYPFETTPNMDRLAAKGAVFENCFVQRVHTRATLPTMLYSRYFVPPIFSDNRHLPLQSPKDLFRKLDDEAVSLPQLLSGQGFTTSAISAHSWLKKGTRFAEEFDEMHNLSTLVPRESRYGFPVAEQTIDYTLRWVDAHKDEDYFLYLHLMDSHFPHFFEEDAQALFGAEEYKATGFAPTGRPRDLTKALEGDDRRYLDALYDGSLRYMDRHLGRLFDRLSAQGRLDRALIVITADHGDFLLEHDGMFAHNGHWYDVLSHVPMIVHYPPRLTATRVASLCEGVDLMPTVLGLLQLDLPKGKQVDGVDLSLVAAGKLTPKSIAVGAGGVARMAPAARNARYKVIFSGQSHEDLLASTPVHDLSTMDGMLFDLKTDPQEQLNLWDGKKAVAQKLLDAYRESVQPSYLRYQRAKTRETPVRTFAVSTLFMTKKPKPERSARRLSGVGPEEISSPRWAWEPMPILGPRAKTHAETPIPSAPAFETAEANGERAIQPIGACTMGISTPSIWVTRLSNFMNGLRILIRGRVA